MLKLSFSLPVLNLELSPLFFRHLTTNESGQNELQLSNEKRDKLFLLLYTASSQN